MNRTAKTLILGSSLAIVAGTAVARTTASLSGSMASSKMLFVAAPYVVSVAHLVVAGVAVKAIADRASA